MTISDSCIKYRLEKLLIKCEEWQSIRCFSWCLQIIHENKFIVINNKVIKNDIKKIVV